MNSYPFGPAPRLNNNSFPPFDPQFPMPGSNFFPSDDLLPPPPPPPSNSSKKRRNNNGSLPFDPFGNGSSAFPPPPFPSNPAPDPYGTQKQKPSPGGFNGFPFGQTQYPNIPPAFPPSSSGKRKKNNNGYVPPPFPPNLIGSPVSSASFGVPPGPIFEPPKKSGKSGGKRKSGDHSKKGDGKKTRRRRDVDWRVRNDQQAYQKVLRNRQAAAKSNEKRRRVRQQYDREIGGLLAQKDDLAKKEKQLKEENRSLRERLRRKF